MKTAWQEAQEWEQGWWGNCVNTYGEEEKGLLYASRMGFQRHPDARTPYQFNGGSKSFLDLGGGPCSILLKFFNLAGGVVVDPCHYPDWVSERYSSAGLG